MRFDYLVDANVIIQYLVREEEEQYQQAFSVLNTKRCYTTIQIMCEVIYILLGHYGVPRTEIVESLRGMYPVLFVEDGAVFDIALSEFIQTPKLDISDCILYGYHVVKEIPVFTFDKKLNKKIARAEKDKDQ